MTLRKMRKLQKSKILKTYVDKLITIDRVEYETERYYYTSYSDYMFGETFGNVNVFDKKNPKHFKMHATLLKPYTYDELVEFAKEYEKEN